MLGVMGEKYETDDIDELILPGFRFHPTDQELVGFYLKRKVQQWPLSIELIKQLDIYKYDPWDLPKLATTGEQEWYFYCPRDRKFRNSARPNRVTESGFWKATGTDRPIYSSDQGTKCIGLKKSLVFYRGRACKGIKTDWMMHEFRLPSLPANLAARKKTSHNNLPPMDSWAICRIFFKKTNSVAQRALSHSCISSLPVNMGSDVQTSSSTCTNRSSLENITSCATDLPSSSSSTTNLSPINFGLPSFLSFMNGDPPMFSTDLDLMKDPSKSTNDVASMLLNLSPALLGDMGKASDSIDLAMVQHQYSTDFSMPREIQKNVHMGEGPYMGQDHTTSYGLQEYPSNLCDAWRSNMLWDYLSSPTEMSINYSNVSGTLD